MALLNTPNMDPPLLPERVIRNNRPGRKLPAPQTAAVISITAIGSRIKGSSQKQLLPVGDNRRKRRTGPVMLYCASPDTPQECDFSAGREHRGEDAGAGLRLVHRSRQVIVVIGIEAKWSAYVPVSRRLRPSPRQSSRIR